MLMKKIFLLMVTLTLIVVLGACSRNDIITDQRNNNPESLETKPENEVGKHTYNSENSTQIILTIGDKVLKGYLNDSEPAKSLISQLPLTVTLNDSDNDFCGGNIDIEYSDSDVQMGYKNGDLAFWTPANNFVIFVDDEEKSENTGDLVILGRITESQEILDSLDGRIDVTIALADKEEKATSGVISNETENTQDNVIMNNTEVSEVKIKITVGDAELFATLENNATTKALVEQMPMTLPMMDLYGREMCYRYGAYALPTDHLQSDGYEIGDIAYWAPGGSLVILYEQNGEHFERQHLGHIDSGVEIFENTGDTDVTFKVVNE